MEVQQHLRLALRRFFRAISAPEGPIVVTSPEPLLLGVS